MSATGKFKAFVGYGIELEYMIVDKGDLSVRPISDVVLRDGSGKICNELEFKDTCWSNELVKHVIELKTNGPAKVTQELVKVFHRDLLKINEILAKENSQIMSSGMHPTFDPAQGVKLWEHDDASIYEAYNRIFDCRGHGWSNLQSMHINLPFYDDSEFERLHAAVRVVLPLLPALAASSPIYEGKYSGFCDSRLEFYRANQKKIPVIIGHVIPEAAWSEAEYREIIYKKITDQIAPHDKDKILEEVWLNSRGAIARFDRNAIEIRVLDVQESPRMDIAIACLVTTFIKALYEGRFGSLAEQKSLDEKTLLPVFIDVVKAGPAAKISHGELLKVCGVVGPTTAKGFWQHIYRELQKDYSAELSGFSEELTVLIEVGCLSERIKKTLGEQPSRVSIDRVYKKICECLAGNKIFS